MAGLHIGSVLGATMAGLAKDVRRFRRRFRLYPTWDEAAKEATYENGDLTEYRALKAEKLIESGQYKGLDTPGLGLLKICVLQLKERIGTVRILDFGGSFGEEGLALMSGSLFRRGISYVVCESTAVKERAQKISYPNHISFIDNLDDAPPTDIFYSSCTLPYVRDVDGVLQAVIGMRPYFVVLVRNCFSDRELIRVQKSPLFHNGPQNVSVETFANQIVHCPHHTQDMARTVAVLEASGYQLLSSIPEDSGVYPYGDEVFGRDLVFVDRTRLELEE